eukprot:CAMPEP_0182420546 /NCGR_PEP_ID=MMETSP1167-20130531/5415_1 /TAXON_ID=2988 /ORGANISM="Mallomonas Sp, Strain CCMP3275" /LENGTH=278 /DNA_ID=CAMNT_0024596623 /DNA_START=168 /DNA_END=1004 /DNA_ORIENTATION=-
MKFFGFKGKVTLGSAKALLHNCKAQTENQIWYNRGLIGSEFRSKHTVLLMHIWMINRRILLEGKDGKDLQECLFDELWEDTCARIRAIGVGELSVNKNLKDVQGYSFRFCMELDHAISLAQTSVKKVDNSLLIEEEKSEEEREHEVLDAMGSTLWRLLYMRREGEGVTDEHVLELARYLRQEQISLCENISWTALCDGRIQWSPLNIWQRERGRGRGREKGREREREKTTLSMNEEEREKEEREGEREREGEWREAIAPDGRTYYWNTVTRESKWTKS